MFYFLSKLLDVFLAPLTWGLVLFALAVPWRRRSARRWKRRRVLGALGIGLLVVASLDGVDRRLQWHLEHPVRDSYKADVTYDAVIMLGGLVNEDVVRESGQISFNDNVERLIVTHRLLRDGHARAAIITGGSRELGEFTEARVVARQLVDWGIAADRIVVEDRAVNTRENAVLSRHIADERGYRRVLVVTSAFHMPRAADCFAAVGMDVDTLAVDYRVRDPSGEIGHLLPRAHSLSNTTIALREIFGRIVYRARGYGAASR